MSLQEWAVAIGLLTPLILGILAFIEKFMNRKKEEPKDEEPELVKGLTVAPDYAGDYIRELKKDRDEAEAELAKIRVENDFLKTQLDKK